MSLTSGLDDGLDDGQWGDGIGEGGLGRTRFINF